MASLSLKQIQTIDKFVHRGGRLLMTGDTIFLDEKGLPKDGCGLQCIGVEKIVMNGDTMRSAYFRIHADQKMGFDGFDTSFGLLNPTPLRTQPKDIFEDTGLIFLDGNYLYTTMKEGATSFWTLVPLFMVPRRNAS